MSVGAFAGDRSFADVAGYDDGTLKIHPLSENPMTDSLETHLRDWRPEPRTETGVVDAGPVAALSAVLDQPVAARAGDDLPPLWHWLHLLEWPPQSDLGEDGHPLSGHFLPPIPDRRRMFAGGRLTIARPLETGAHVERVSTLDNCGVKEGRTGEMAFVTVRSEYRQDGEARVTEELDYVYRSGDDARRSFTTTTEPPPEDGAPWRIVPVTDPAALFRFSALTANAHRIHYDVPYATGVEGYPGLVVHGPLLVLLMLELVRRNTDRRVGSVSFRLRRPVFAGDRIVVTGRPEDDGAELAVASAAEPRHATAQVRFAGSED
ncbi:MaoC family dehydratase N-terminal domain-containing protein [Prauserella sp. PE36]|uniref:FAS1-like dehydratase domain-containing protein n=1 Tax=Prauserella sp. PE36 TaxID=1504709 RepID=UPI001F28474E|nr:MaoC family dehydratase N-terminal domain-containing protein [Prauserella sp. PE36]